ncbi:MAG: ABC transporter permease subunit [Verrucomicrobiae bacterium]|nr:ABC transporter permease subunit [Verrucomicrobiae bacterium]
MKNPNPLAPAADPLLMFSLGRVWAIAANTMTELIRQKVFYVFLIFGIVVISSATFFSQFTPEDQFKFIKDFCLGAISIIAMIFSIVGTALLIPAELERRTIYTVLARPVFRVEFLLGKFLGQVMILLVTVGVMSVVFAGVILAKEQVMVAEARAVFAATPAEMRVPGDSAESQVERIHRNAWDSNLVKAVVLICVKYTLVTAVTVFVSSFSGSVVFITVISFSMYLIGHLQSIAQEAWAAQMDVFRKGFLVVVGLLIPDLQKFNVVDEIVLGKALTWGQTLFTSGYGVSMTLAYLLLAWLIFEFREI